MALPALVLGSIAIGASPIFVRWSELGPVATAFHRVLWALPLLWLWQGIEARRTAAPVAGRRMLWLAGLLFAGDLTLWHLSILNTTVANATLFANFAPVVVTLGAWLVLRERIERRFVLGLGLCMAGAAALIGSSIELKAEYVRGDIYGVITAGFFGSYLVAVKALRERGHAPGRIMLWSGMVTCGALLALTLAVGETLWPETWLGLAVLIGLAWTSQVGGQGLIAYGVGHLPASFTSLVILIEPLTAAVLGWWLLGEALGALQFLGGAAILAGILVARQNGTS